MRRAATEAARTASSHTFLRAAPAALPWSVGWSHRNTVPTYLRSSGGPHHHRSKSVFTPLSSPHLTRTSSMSNITTSNTNGCSGRSYEEAVATLGNLVSNAETMAAWAKERLTNKELDFREEVLELLRRIDVDVGKLNCVHVAGTKGKGSTCAFAESILRRGYGLRTGLYTSPHLVHIRERIRIDGKPIEEEMFAKYFWDTWDRLHATQPTDGRPTTMPAFFRFVTLIAFRVFLEEKVDVAVIEVGVGGRTDTTNVVSPSACGISSLGYDHQNVLGDTLTEIAYEKAGIMKPGVHAFTVPQEEEAMLSLVNQATIKQVMLDVVPPLEAWGGQQKLGLLGEFQKYNASLAIAICREWLNKNFDQLPSHISGSLDLEPFLRTKDPMQLPAGFRRGLEECKWPGRAQIVQLPASQGGGQTWFYLDGAHTEESVEVCARWFCGDDDDDDASSAHFSRNDGEDSERRVLIFNCNQTRSPSKLLSKLASTTGLTTKSGKPVFDQVIFTTLATKPGQQVAISPGSVAAAARGQDVGPLSWQHTQADVWRGLERAVLPLPDADSNPRVAHNSNVLVVDSISAALDAALSGSSKNTSSNPSDTKQTRTKILVTGSLYLIGGVLDVLLARNVLPPSSLDL